MSHGQTDFYDRTYFFAMVWPGEAERLAELRPQTRGGLQAYDSMLRVFMRLKLSDRNGSDEPWGHYLGQLAESMGLSRRAFSDALKRLEDFGLIQKRQNNRGQTCFLFPLKGVDAKNPLWSASSAVADDGNNGARQKVFHAHISSAELYAIFEDGERSVKGEGRQALQSRALRLLCMVFVKLQAPIFATPNPKAAKALDVCKSTIDRAIDFFVSNGVCVRSPRWSPATGSRLSSRTSWCLQGENAPNGSIWDPVRNGSSTAAMVRESTLELQILSAPIAGPASDPFPVTPIFSFKPQAAQANHADAPGTGSLNVSQGRQGSRLTRSTGVTSHKVDTPPVDPERGHPCRPRERQESESGSEIYKKKPLRRASEVGPPPRAQRQPGDYAGRRQAHPIQPASPMPIEQLTAIINMLDSGCTEGAGTPARAIVDLIRAGRIGCDVGNGSIWAIKSSVDRVDTENTSLYARARNAISKDPRITAEVKRLLRDPGSSKRSHSLSSSAEGMALDGEQKPEPQELQPKEPEALEVERDVSTRQREHPQCAS